MSSSDRFWPVAACHIRGLIADSSLTPSKVLIPNCQSLLVGKREFGKSFIPVSWVYFRPLTRYTSWLSNTPKKFMLKQSVTRTISNKYSRLSTTVTPVTFVTLLFRRMCIPPLPGSINATSERQEQFPILPGTLRFL